MLQQLLQQRLPLPILQVLQPHAPSIPSSHSACPGQGDAHSVTQQQQQLPGCCQAVGGAASLLGQVVELAAGLVMQLLHQAAILLARQRRGRPCGVPQLPHLLAIGALQSCDAAVQVGVASLHTDHREAVDDFSQMQSQHSSEHLPYRSPACHSRTRPHAPAS